MGLKVLTPLHAHGKALISPVLELLLGMFYEKASLPETHIESKFFIFLRV
jgi:hypothetical protein